MDERVRFIAALGESEESFAELCRRFGISRKTGYKWAVRYEEQGVEGLVARPPVARQVRHATAVELVTAVVLARKAHPSWGPKKLRAWLAEQDPEKPWPAASTIGEQLLRHGLIHPRRRRARVAPREGALDRCARPNDVWCADFKGDFALGDGTRCYPLTLTDGCSRYLLKCEALEGTETEPARAQFDLAFREYGLPGKMRTDNGPPFASLAVGGLSALSVWWIKLGIVPERIDPGHPEQNGRHERMHRTLKAEATVPPQATQLEQQRAFDHFRHEYNDERPHEALGQQAPCRYYDVSPRSYPRELVCPEYPDMEVRWVQKKGPGSISFGGRQVRVGALLVGEPVGLRQVGPTQWEAFYGPVRLGVIDERDAEPRLLARRRKGHAEREAVPAERGEEGTP